ncbi:hypothetical protein NHF50_01825 [Flavobacterium sp. NRK F10]|uniref:hypothetical protein n=1 Tax=Flavobacterium sp. NRK F10 TaxID=2954931 RepID=UPI001474E2B4|nr:hypothetical protein [Flavobacterium sp. NRK F10]MCO6173777.1 hypothetical protein [Flavobacterium sp. NRK F10]
MNTLDFPNLTLQQQKSFLLNSQNTSLAVSKSLASKEGLHWIHFRRGHFML